MEKIVIAYIKASLRRIWGRSKQRQWALKDAKVSRGKYKCAKCGKIFSKKNINVDHINAIGRFKDWNVFIEKLFCDAKTGLQILCVFCHSTKTKKDRKK